MTITITYSCSVFWERIVSIKTKDEKLEYLGVVFKNTTHPYKIEYRSFERKSRFSLLDAEFWTLYYVEMSNVIQILITKSPDVIDLRSQKWNFRESQRTNQNRKKPVESVIEFLKNPYEFFFRIAFIKTILDSF
ncbi:hypothetical protein LEP1GSC036_3814 [Leptospira weilii str. 2006001853]|uniref:Uncharacterized protein n=1 Tax=Leptospira weilii str. 2006001853 TaxID=1001589 RepID=A0A828YZ80_9LEPT|nr:hypothetical protein LEP1GSC036_3814 [Leptospira weilii str. 2006001853]EMN43856.1 hypothetical protein LEP1GSC086_4510 [Leptospira weilii str. LNT 1234]